MDPLVRRGRGGLTTVGTGTASAVPDVVVARLGVEVTDRSAAEAHAGAAEALERVRGVVLAAVASPSDVATAGATSWTDPGQGRPTTTVRLTLAVRLPVGSDAVGRALAAAGDAGRLDGVELVVSDPAAARTAARAAAYADAVGAARELAALAGRPLGAVVDVREGGDGPVVGPWRGGAETVLADAAAVAVDPGRQDVVVRLVVRHAWADEV